MFDKILIANRGEITCRVARTAQRMGIRTVAVYSDADAGALHVSACDEAYLIGAAPARESYLRAERIIDAALRSGAQALHPGYGFLSENADFVEACSAAGLIFIGPPASAMRAMGSKSAAKTLMSGAGVPLLPGYQGEDQDVRVFREEAQRIGYPLLVKASAGGGGKGMRIVRTATELDQALASARREAASAFGDDRLLLEKYLDPARHIEVQVFADTHGNTIHLFERDCSLQRRHQKVVEEAPAPGMTAARRRQMGSVAVAAARAVEYVNAGTVEFIVDQAGEFYFMEMNTRLQVEHAVTEMITGLDLVEWQLRVAAGEPLPLHQDQISANGHALEARIYAEDAQRDFLPSAGRIAHLRTPADSRHVRVEIGVREGDEVGVHYDPMIAKLVAWDIDRDSALRRLRHALSEFQVAGLATNVSFLHALAGHPAFAKASSDAGLLHTGLIARLRDELLAGSVLPPPQALAVAALSELMRIDQEAEITARDSGDPNSPWNSRDGWRLNEDNHHTFEFRGGGRQVAVTAHYRRNRYLLEFDDARMLARGHREADGTLALNLDGRWLKATVVRQGSALTLLLGGNQYRLELEEYLALEDEDDSGSLSAPMPGSVIEVLARAGERVEKGAVLMILEAMKMEHAIQAPAQGVIAEVLFARGDQVREGDQLIRFEVAEKAL